MPKPEIEVVGLRELVKDLKAAQDKELDAELKSAQLEAAQIVRDAALPLVPQASGALLGTVRASATLRSGRVAAGKKLVPYANPIHWGWPAHNIAAQPFLIDALESRREQALESISDAVADLTERIGAHT